MFVGGDNLGGWWFILWLNCLFRWISMDTQKEGQKKSTKLCVWLDEDKYGQPPKRCRAGEKRQRDSATGFFLFVFSSVVAFIIH